MDKTEPLQRFVRKIQSARFEAATGPATLCGLAVELDERTGLARMVAPVRIGGRLDPVVPAGWLPVPSA